MQSQSHQFFLVFDSHGSSRERIGDVHLLDIGKMSDPAGGFGHALGNTPAQAHDLDFLDDVIAHRSGPQRSALLHLQISVEILMTDAPGWTRATDLSKIQSSLKRASAHGW